MTAQTHRPAPPASPELAGLLASCPPDLAAAIRRRLADLRPSVMFDSERVGAGPMRAGLFDRMLGRRAAPPLPEPLASKFAGAPYSEREGELEGGRFVGQVNFEEVARALHAQGAPRPAGMPDRGLLAVDLTGDGFSGRVRWYPEPHEEKQVRLSRWEWVGRWETRFRFRGSWTLRGLEWFDGLEDRDELWTWMNDLELPGVDDDARDGHKLFGHPNEALNEHYGFTPPRGRSGDVREYALVWRITFDNPAGLRWGTNWLYVLVHRDDLAVGALHRAIVTGANA